MIETPIYKFAVREDLKNCGFSFLPEKAEPLATGWDVKCAFANKQSVTLKPFQYIKIPLGFRAFCPKDWWFELKPRSSTFGKKSLHALYGTIDESYEGELLFAAQYIPYFDPYQSINGFIINNVDNLELKFGEAIGQIVPVKRQEMNVLEVSNEEYDLLCKSRNSNRGTGGFGSTGDLKNG